MIFRNLTPHAVKIYNREYEIIMEVAPEARDMQARVGEIVVDSRVITTFGGKDIEVVVKDYTDANLPEPRDGVYLIVSKMVIDACPDRQDLLCPDTGPDSVVRDEVGKILGVKRLQAVN